MEKIITDEKKIDEILNKAVEECVDKDILREQLLSGKQLRIKLGVDPTGPKIHLGRAIPIRKLREFQKLGHKVVFIVGDFTAQVGDASDKTDKRPMLTKAKIDENLKDYKSQISKIIDVEKAEFVYNSTWLSKLTFNDVAEMAECFSVQQMLARRNFKERYDAGVEISLREFLYPLMQGYDSVAVKSDVELGGFDQLFNLKAGRIIQEHYGQEKQHILISSMLEGLDGRKMSTSWGNIITIVDEPADMFGKVMSLRDELIEKYFYLCTNVHEEERNTITEELKNGVNPRDVKMRLALELVTMYHGEKEASLAKNSFIEAFQKGGVPTDIEEIIVKEGELISDILVDKKIVVSKTDWRRLIDDNAVSLNGENLSDVKAVAQEGVYKIGKKRFVKLSIHRK